jgi:hypothetical protein
MDASNRYNEFMKENGGSGLYMDENLVLEREIREEIVFWGSVYHSKFVEMPDNAFVSEIGISDLVLENYGNDAGKTHAKRI